MRIPDPIEIMSANIDRMVDAFMDENTCMGCRAKVDYELVCMSPVGDGPALCYACAGPSAIEYYEGAIKEAE